MNEALEGASIANPGTFLHLRGSLSVRTSSTPSSWCCHHVPPDSYAVFATTLLRIDGVSVS